jgi:hypothetical protein
MGKNLKVSTRTYNARRREERVLSLLRDSPEGLTPKSIGSMTVASSDPLNTNTIKSILKRLELSRKIRKKMRGYYVLVDNPIHDVFSYNLHNIILTYTSNEIEINSKINETIDTYLGKIRFGVGKGSKKATMCISTDYPFSFSGIGLIAACFKERVKMHCNIDISAEDIIINSIEFNKDYGNLKFEGLNSVTLSSCLADFKVYQKNNRIRKEYRVKVPFSMDILLGILNSDLSNSNYIQNIATTEEKLNRIEKKMEWMSRFLVESVIKSNSDNTSGWTASVKDIEKRGEHELLTETFSASELYTGKETLL